VRDFFRLLQLKEFHSQHFAEFFIQFSVDRRISISDVSRANVQYERPGASFRGRGKLRKRNRWQIAKTMVDFGRANYTYADLVPPRH
jgi:hypothetical protein